METNPFGVTIQVSSRFERGPEDFGHLGIDRNQTTRWNFGYHNPDRHLLLDRVGERSLGTQAQLSIVRGTLGNSPLYLGHHSHSQSGQNVDGTPAPIAGMFIERAQRTKHVTVFGNERHTGVSSEFGTALRESGFIPGIRDHDRHSRTHDILAKRSFKRVPAG